MEWHWTSWMGVGTLYLSIAVICSAASEDWNEKSVIVLVFLILSIGSVALFTLVSGMPLDPPGACIGITVPIGFGAAASLN